MSQSSGPTHYCLFDTTLGWCGLAWSGRGLTRLQLSAADRAATEKRMRATGATLWPQDPPPAVAQAIAAIRRHLDGMETSFDAIALDLAQASDIERRIYDELRTIRFGQTTTYGELARRVGLEGDARPVGEAMGRNPLPVIIPCHRVLANGNRIGGFSAPGGTATKERLLALEGVRLDADAPRLPGL